MKPNGNPGKFSPNSSQTLSKLCAVANTVVRKIAGELNCSFERSISRLQTARGDKKPNLCKQTDCASHGDEFSREYRTLISSSLWTVQSSAIADWAHSAKTNPLSSSVVRDLVRCLMWPLHCWAVGRLIVASLDKNWCCVVRMFVCVWTLLRCDLSSEVARSWQRRRPTGES